MKSDLQIIRRLANDYYHIANSPQNLENILRHKSVNDLHGDRPIVLIDEIPWEEMNLDDELTLQCQDEFYRQIEFHFRTVLYKWRHMRADMAVEPYFPVYKQIHTTGIGLDRLENEHDASAQSFTFVDQLQTEEDLEKLHRETITYDEAATLQAFHRTCEALGDVLPVRLKGQPTSYSLGCKTMDDIVNLRGLENLFMDLVERPEFMHALIGKMTDIWLDKVRQYNELGLFDGDAYILHGTSALTNDLHPDQTHVTSKDVWGRGLAQIFASVSPEMHDEFDAQYMVRAMEPFGLVYYGCCEPLDQKIHILKKIPHLRKISITPWANIDHAAEIMQDQYVVASKPNPSALAVATLDEDSVRKELRRIVDACKRNGCSCDIVLKDITTVRNRPQNLFRWCEIAMEEACR